LLSPAGITFANGRSTSFFDWRDVGQIAQTRGMAVATLDYQGVVMPDRLLAQMGDPDTIKGQIISWHQSAQATA
jgi:hypothetical protein